MELIYGKHNWNSRVKRAVECLHPAREVGRDDCDYRARQAVGRLVPYFDSLAERLEAMQAVGFISWSGQSLTAGEPAVANKSKQLVSDLLLEDRE